MEEERLVVWGQLAHSWAVKSLHMGNCICGIAKQHMHMHASVCGQWCWKCVIQLNWLTNHLHQIIGCFLLPN